MIDPKIEEIDVQLFFKFMLKHLTPPRANMILGQNVDEAKKIQMERILQYLKTEMPQAESVNIEAYIRSVAEEEVQQVFPYVAGLDIEKLDCFRRSLCSSYNFFVFIFVSAPLEQTVDCSTLFNWLVGDLKYTLMSKVEGQAVISQLYGHLKQLFATEKQIPDLGMQALLYIILNFIKENKNEEELKSVYDLLLYTRAGRYILRDIEKEYVAEWIELLSKEQLSIFIEKIVSSTGLLENGEICIGKLKTDQFKGIKERVSYTEFLINSVFMKICRNEGLIKKLACNVKHYFYFDFLFDTDEKKRAAISNEDLITSGRGKIGKFFKHSILTLELIRSIGHIQLSGKINQYKEEWLRAHKGIVALSVQYWEPSYEDLQQITRIWTDWIKFMGKRLADNDEGAYNPEHYEFDKLPIELKMAFKICKGHVGRYQDHLVEMQSYYQNILHCHEAPNNSVGLQADLKMEGYISFVDLIKEVVAKKGLKGTKEQIQCCAEKLTELFLEVTKSPEMPEKLKFLHLRGKQFNGEPEVFHIKMDSYKLFYNSLQEKKAVVITKRFTSKFTSIDLFLNEAKAMDAIRELLIPPAVQENENPHKVYFSLS